MKDKNYKQLAEELYALISETFTTTDAVVTSNEQGIFIHTKRGDYYADSFHYMEEVVDFARCNRLREYVAAEIENGKPVVIVHIF